MNKPTQRRNATLAFRLGWNRALAALTPGGTHYDPAFDPEKYSGDITQSFSDPKRQIPEFIAGAKSFLYQRSLYDSHQDCNRKIKALEDEVSRLRSFAIEETIRAELAEKYEQWLLDIGKLSGCGHVDERLPRCIEELVFGLQIQVSELREKVAELEQLRSDK